MELMLCVPGAIYTFICTCFILAKTLQGGIIIPIFTKEET